MQIGDSERASLAGQEFDILVIGGGINGVAIARECARNGRRVALVEQHDFASGTTSRSTRIIHGGLRYLEHGEIGLVRESLRERERLMRRHPHLVRPMEFLLALGSRSRSFTRSSLAIRTGLWLYHHWAGSHPDSESDAERFERQLDGGSRWSVYPYEDAQCEFPERLVAEWLMEAAADGISACNYAQVLEILLKNGRVTGARIRDEASGHEFPVNAGTIVNAAGPWVDFVLSRSNLQSKQLVGGVRGSHLIVPQFIGMPAAAVYTEALDGRTFFVLPWNTQVLVGTTEVADSGDPTQVQAAETEIDYLFASLLRLFPQSGLTKTDIRYSFAGVRPLPFSPGEKLSAVTRRHVIHDHRDEGAAGMISIIGGKLTTAMSLAREVARKLGIPVSEPANVFAAPVPENGIESTLQQWAHLVACKARISETSAHAVAEWHGQRALAIAGAAAFHEDQRAPLCSHSQHIVAEAVEAVTHEYAITLADILLRRVPVALGPCWSEACSAEAASRIGAALRWDNARIQRELERFEEERERFLHPRTTSATSQLQDPSHLGKLVTS